MNSITGVILTSLSEQHLFHSLDSLSFCDELLLVVDAKDDETLKKKIFAKYPHARVSFRLLDDDFSAQRNFALTHVHTEWCLFLDADEEVPELCRNEILRAVQNSDITGYYLKREDFLWGKHLKYGEVKNIWLLRLAKKSAGNWTGNVHEIWNISGRTTKLSSPFFHYPHPSITEFIYKIDRYTTLRAKELHDQGISSSLFSILFYTKAKFFYTYIIQQGFRDGIPGFLLSIFMSFHSFLVRAKLYLLKKRTK